MLNPVDFEKFHRQFDDLLIVVRESHARIVRDPADSLFIDYLNVFTKSYVVSACSILEAFIQELAFSYIQIFQSRISSTNIPRNIILWATNSEPKPKDFRFEQFKIEITKKDISDLVSGNYFKTIKIFERIGVNLEADPGFIEYKDFIGSTIDKRNSIVHHNDDASDISLIDIINTIGKFKSYTMTLQNIVESSPHFIISVKETKVDNAV